MKKLLDNIYTFLHISLNWNPFLAAFIFWHELKRGPKYGINTIKPEQFKKLTIVEGDITKSSPYEAVSYFLLENLLEVFCRLSDQRTITDLGCGKGRVLVTAAYFGFTDLYGVEFARELCAEANRNLEATNIRMPGIQWKIHCGDVTNYPVKADESVFFLFNPFNAETLGRFLQRLEISLNEHPRTTWFIYASPLHMKNLLEKGYHIVYHHQPTLGKLEGVILKK